MPTGPNGKILEVFCPKTRSPSAYLVRGSIAHGSPHTTPRRLARDSPGLCAVGPSKPVAYARNPAERPRQGFLFANVAATSRFSALILSARDLLNAGFATNNRLRERISL